MIPASPPPFSPPGAWYADPYGRALQRYWNGSAWTAYVVDAAGHQGVDDSTVAPPHASQTPTATASGQAIVIQNIVQYPQHVGYPAHAFGVPMLKSPATAGWLAFCFGPLGMFYSTVSGAVIMLVISIVVIPLTLGLGVLITWPVSIIWAVSAARQHNASILAGSMLAAPQPVRPAAPGVGYVAHPAPRTMSPPASPGPDLPSPISGPPR